MLGSFLCAPGHRGRTASTSTVCKLAQDLDDVTAQPLAPLGVEERLDRGRILEHVSGDPGHDVEGRVVDRLVGAQAERGGHRDGGGAEGGNDAMLAPHIVRGGQQGP